MKTICTILLLCSFTAAQRDEHLVYSGQQPNTASHDNMRMLHSKSASISSADDSAKQVLTVTLGPLRLPAKSQHSEIEQLPPQFFELPFEGWITAYHPKLVDRKGTALPGRLLHHVAFHNLNRSDVLCPAREEHNFGAGGELNDWPATPGFGYPVNKGDRMRITAMFHNPTATDYMEVFLEVKMEYRQAAQGGVKSVYPVWFDVRECGPSGYDLKPGENLTSGEFRVKYPGRLLGVGGHMHDYGRELRLESVSGGKEIARLQSKLNEKGEMVSMPVVMFAAQGGWPLAADEQVKVTALYDNPTGRELHEGAMGIVVGYLLPDNDGAMSSLRRSKNTKAAKANE